MSSINCAVTLLTQISSPNICTDIVISNICIEWNSTSFNKKKTPVPMPSCWLTVTHWKISKRIPQIYFHCFPLPLLLVVLPTADDDTDCLLLCEGILEKGTMIKTGPEEKKEDGVSSKILCRIRGTTKELRWGTMNWELRVDWSCC